MNNSTEYKTSFFIYHIMKDFIQQENLTFLNNISLLNLLCFY